MEHESLPGGHSLNFAGRRRLKGPIYVLCDECAGETELLKQFRGTTALAVAVLHAEPKHRHRMGTSGQLADRAAESARNLALLKGDGTARLADAGQDGGIVQRLDRRDVDDLDGYPPSGQ